MFFDEDINFRLQEKDRIRIGKLLKKDGGEKYDNESHFCRCAVLKLLKEEEVKP